MVLTQAFTLGDWVEYVNNIILGEQLGYLQHAHLLQGLQTVHICHWRSTNNSGMAEYIRLGNQWLKKQGCTLVPKLFLTDKNHLCSEKHYKKRVVKQAKCLLSSVLSSNMHQRKWAWIWGYRWWGIIQGMISCTNELGQLQANDGGPTHV